ncbi:EthD domain-containing protein [Rhizorhabdus dicambivorans]|uniref:Ethyl tert-butyl ether degradation protein EthD n=1 Tax=Rhizorhabdus dicambivorans TaxID=1850238 RepID=A0A2A4FZU4_9SPHN|nr:EthD domain-containing protein [Rhizorhabdus dicambivorans]ATE65843.1 ethyl tert-butyl ether degradation protein EthD [Rhizorhabdus dicambivorans]PCE42957.1 ethyl tert-butyl ether degradation protein EthD [Rhizorhabdus dicambivorans]
MKLLCLLTRKAGMTHQEFRDYYEANHVPLISRLLPFFTAYERNYLNSGYSFSPAHVEERFAGPTFDVVTEISFASVADYQRMLDALTDPTIGDPIRRDEENFLDRASLALYMVDTVSSPGALTMP